MIFLLSGKLPAKPESDGFLRVHVQGGENSAKNGMDYCFVYDLPGPVARGSRPGADDVMKKTGPGFFSPVSPASGSRVILFCAFMLLLAGCGTRGGMKGILTPVDVLLIHHHMRRHYACLQEFSSRLYRKNPKYEPDPAARQAKLRAVFLDRTDPGTPYDHQPSHEILTAAFAPDPGFPDRVLLLALGLRKSIDEGYGRAGPQDDSTLLTSLQMSPRRLERLYSNLKQVNWRLKVCRDTSGQLLFLTNACSPDGHLNMGYEVLMTRVLTRIEDDIYLRGGTPPNVVFRMSTIFLSLFM